MKNKFLLILFIGLTSCAVNKYALWKDQSSALRGPLYSDYLNTKTKSHNCNWFNEKVVFYEECDYDSICYQYSYFWPNGNCLSSGIYDTIIDDLHLNNKSGYQGKYCIINDTLSVEYFVGGNPGNIYLHYNYKMYEDSLVYINVGERVPGKEKIRYPKWMQERHRANLKVLPKEREEKMQWEANW